VRIFLQEVRRSEFEALDPCSSRYRPNSHPSHAALRRSAVRQGISSPRGGRSWGDPTNTVADSQLRLAAAAGQVYPAGEGLECYLPPGSENRTGVLGQPYFRKHPSPKRRRSLNEHSILATGQARSPVLVATRILLIGTVAAGTGTHLKSRT
jgi:hypothetical protein